MTNALNFDGIPEADYHNLSSKPRLPIKGSCQGRIAAHFKNFWNDVTTLFHRTIHAITHFELENNESLLKHLIEHFKDDTVLVKNQDTANKLFRELKPGIQNKALKKEYKNVRSDWQPSNQGSNAGKQGSDSPSAQAADQDQQGDGEVVYREGPSTGQYKELLNREPAVTKVDTDQEEPVDLASSQVRRQLFPKPQRTDAEKMHRNLEKAIAEHYGIKMEDIPSLNLPIYHDTPHPVTISAEYAFSDIGKRDNNEDYHFSTYLEGIGHVSIICDGHGDAREISTFAGQKLQELFPAEYLKNERNFKKTMGTLFPQINIEILESREPNGMTVFSIGGTTATFSLLDTATGQLHVASLGDSEVKIFAKDATGTIRSVPFSLQRDWESPVETRRIERAQQEHYSINLRTSEEVREYAEELAQMGHPLPKTFKPTLFIGSAGMNVSRSLGDKDYVEKGLGYDRPTVSSLQLPPNTEIYMIAGCDGLWDVVDQDDTDLIAEFLQPNWDNPEKIDLAQALVKYALEKKSTDNVSVVMLKVNSD